jgi:hypothetical protein
MSIEAMTLALEALEAHADFGIKADRAITALRQAIEEGWVGLTDEEFDAINNDSETPGIAIELTEAKLKEKNDV